ncbi:non-specific serine/threonine protein kinase [Malassezia equina]|uniref:non-specific serine/threonine protein kinase n=1 Tax=Malassezia equina TaxID=1381935 RepID=A0AAF0IZF0_9BASI|nr:non-specific serine/threonine protein kinase [Malassezia equina]
MGPDVLRDNWDPKLTVRQNYAKLGLVPNMGQQTGGLDRDDPYRQAAMNEHPSVPENKSKIGMARVIRDENGKVVDIVEYESDEDESKTTPWGEQLNQDDEVADLKLLVPRLNEGQEGETVKALEKIAAENKPVERFASVAEHEWLVQLIEAHGSDYKAMSLDRKRNIWQKTAGEIKRATRPFITEMEKLWISYQIIYALNAAHERNIAHGDLKCENVLVTSSLAVYVTDFASSFKPTYLPLDDPADFSLFFDTSGRRTCYIAPERFYDSVTDLPMGFNPARMRTEDIENVSEVLTYEPYLEMLGLGRPNGRITEAMDVFSLGCVLAELWRDGTPLFTLSQLFRYRKGELDLSTMIEEIQHVGIRDLVQRMLHLDPSQRPSLHDILLPGEDVFLGIYIPGLALTPYMARKSAGKDAKALIVLGVVLANMRHCQRASARCHAIELTLHLAWGWLSDDAILDRVLPYLSVMLDDSSSVVRAMALHGMAVVLECLHEIPSANEGIWTEFVLPNLAHVTTDKSEYLQEMARKYMDTIALYHLGSDDGTVKVWDTARLEKNVTTHSRLTYTSHAAPITDVLVLHGTHCIVSTAKDGSIHAWGIALHTNVSLPQYSRPHVLGRKHLNNKEHIAMVGSDTVMATLNLENSQSSDIWQVHTENELVKEAEAPSPNPFRELADSSEGPPIPQTTEDDLDSHRDSHAVHAVLASAEGYSSTVKDNAAPTGYVITAGSDRVFRYWDLGSAEKSVAWGCEVHGEFSIKHGHYTFSGNTGKRLPTRSPLCVHEQTTSSHAFVKSHKDVITCMARLEVPFRCVVAGDRAGALRIWE